MSRYSRYYCSYIIVLALVIEKSHTVSVRPDNDELEPLKSMKPSPIDESQQPNEKSLINLDRSLVDKLNASKNKREDSSDDNKSDVKFGDNADHREKEIRKFLGPFADLNKFSHCCGSRFEVSGPSGRPDSVQQFTTRPSESDRYPNRLGSRPDDRYGWQSSSARPSGGSLSGGSLYGGQGSRPDRYGWRPYGSGPDSEYGRPPMGARPAPSRPGYGYGDSGAYGSSGFETSRPGIHFTGGSRPSESGYGIHGTIGEQDEFPGDAGGADAPPRPPSNIQTQKAVALKALAGVALIGAAAALAANPVLLPVGVLAGRKRRAIENLLPSDDVQFLYGFLQNHVPRIDEEITSEEFWNEPKCIARLTCELQQHYLTTMKNNKLLLQKAPLLKQRLKNQMEQLIQSEIARAEDVHHSLQLLLKMASNMGFTQDSCKMLECSLYVP